MTDRHYRGSRKHVLDWVEEPNFRQELEALLEPLPVTIGPDAPFMPRGYGDSRELRLERAPLEFAVLRPWLEELRRWWLVHHHGANTPNWDLAVACQVEGRPGMILVEAKANASEVKRDPKPSPRSPNGWDNDRQIRRALDEARDGFDSRRMPVNISADSHYQLSNRLALTWRLATYGIPTVLVYLGFVGDADISDVGAPFESADDWRRVFLEHSAGVISPDLLDRRLDLGAAPAWVLVRALAVRPIPS